MEDDDVAELSAPAHRAAVGLAAENQAAPDAGAQRQHDEIVHAASGAGFPLTDRRRVGVVVDPDGKREALMHPLAEAQPRKRQVYRAEHHARALVDG